MVKNQSLEQQSLAQIVIHQDKMPNKERFIQIIKKQKKEGGGKLYFYWLLKLHTLFYSKEYKKPLKEGLSRPEIANFLFGKNQRPDIRYFMDYLEEIKILQKLNDATSILLNEKFRINKKNLEEEIEKWKAFMEVYDYCDRRGFIL